MNDSRGPDLPSARARVASPIRRHLVFGLALLALATARPASADYGWCTIQKDGSYDTYVSAVVDVGSAPDAYQDVLVRQFGKAFQGYVGQFESIVREPDCHSSKRLSDAEDMNQRYGGDVGAVIRTGWRGSWPNPGAAVAKPEPKPTAPHLTVEPVAPRPDPQAVRAQQAQQAKQQRERAEAAAAQQARALADAAAKDARWKAMVEADREARRRCPRCQ